MEALRSAPKRRTSIAVVEPDDALRDSLVFALRIDGYDVSAFVGPTDFLEAAQARQFACLVVAGRLGGQSAGSVIGRYWQGHGDGKVVLLGDGRGVSPQADNLKTLAKPLIGGSVGAAVAALLSHGL